MTNVNNEFSLTVQQEMVSMSQSGISATRIGQIMGKYTTSITRVLKRHGLRMPSGKGEEHSNWQGGRGKKAGYWTVYNPTHPRAMNIGRVWEHILVVEEHIGRPVTKSEPIHHIDFNGLNNDISNLYLCASNSEHRRLHISLQDVTREAIERGIIRFERGKYVLV